MTVTVILVLSLAACAGGQIISSPEIPIPDTRGPCYDRLDCFPGGPPYYFTLERPIGFPPRPPEEIDVQFLLLTRKNPEKYQVIRAVNVNLNSIHNDTEINGTNFDPNLKSIFIVHGFGEKGDKFWLVEMCQAFLKVSDVNCFCVDWRKGALTLYTQACSNVRVVGAEIANILRFMGVKYNYSMDWVTMIGHSLGGQVLGEAGKRQKGIAVMVGLDAAGPYFENVSALVRLDCTDARFVVAIHTDGPRNALHLGFGTRQLIGHVDIFANGGENMPGCPRVSANVSSFDAVIEDASDIVFCSHQFSFRIYNASISNPGGFIAYRASSYADFQQGAGFPCTNDSCMFMGYKAELYASHYQQNSTANRMFFLNTGNFSSFPRWRFLVSMAMRGSDSVAGSLSVSLCGTDECSDFSQIFSGPLNSGEEYSAFIDVEKDVHPVQRVRFTWSKSLLFLLPAKVGASAITVQYGPTGETSKFCGGDPTEENTSQTLEKC